MSGHGVLVLAAMSAGSIGASTGVGADQVHAMGVARAGHAEGERSAVLGANAEPLASVGQDWIGAELAGEVGAVGDGHAGVLYLNIVPLRSACVNNLARHGSTTCYTVQRKGEREG